MWCTYFVRVPARLRGIQRGNACLKIFKNEEIRKVKNHVLIKCLTISLGTISFFKRLTRIAHLIFTVIPSKG